MATARRSDSPSPTFRIWWTVPRGTHTMSSLAAWMTVPPVSSHSRRPSSTTHHSSNSRCQCGRLPPPGALAISVTSWRSSAMIRFAHGAGPLVAAGFATRVCRTWGPVAPAAGGLGPAASLPMTIVTSASAMGTLSSRWVGTITPGAAPGYSSTKNRTGRSGSDASGHVDGHAGDEVRVARGEEADHPRLVRGLGHAAQRRARDFPRPLLRRPLLPVRPDPLGQRHAGGDGVDRDAEGAQLVRELRREGDDAALGGRVRAAAARADAATGDGRDVHDLAAPLALHDRHDGAAAEKRPLEVERDEALPVVERELVHRGGGGGGGGGAPPPRWPARPWRRRPPGR